VNGSFLVAFPTACSSSRELPPYLLLPVYGATKVNMCNLPECYKGSDVSRFGHLAARRWTPSKKAYLCGPLFPRLTALAVPGKY
jgi:hypothetical protein